MLYRTSNNAIRKDSKPARVADWQAGYEDARRGLPMPACANQTYARGWKGFHKDDAVLKQQIALMRLLKNHGVPINGYTCWKAKQGAGAVLELIDKHKG